MGSKHGAASGAGTRSTDRSTPGRDLLVLLGVSGAVLVVSCLTSIAIKIDSCEYVELARALSVGQFTAIHAHDYPPLYPLLIAFAHEVIPDWTVAGQFVTALSTWLCLVPLYRIGRMAIGRDAAFAGALLFAMHPLVVEWGGMVVSDGPYLLVWLFSLQYAILAAHRRKLTDYGVCGALSGLAYLIRPEGLQSLVVLAILVVATKGSWTRRAGGLVLAGTLCAVTMAPYAGILSYNAGYVVLSKKKAILQFPQLRFKEMVLLPLASALPQDLAPPPITDPTDATQVAAFHRDVRRRWIEAEALALEYKRLAQAQRLVPDDGDSWPIPGGSAQRITFDTITDAPQAAPPRGKFLLEFAEKFHPFPFALLVVGAAWATYRAVRRTLPRSLATWGLALGFAMHLVLVLDNNWRHGYLSERHLIPLTAVGLLGAAIPLVALEQRLARTAAHLPWLAPHASRVPGLATIALVLILGIDSLRPRGRDKDYLALLSTAISRQDPRGLGIDGVIGREPRLAFYADVVDDKFDPWRGYREVIRQLYQHQCRYVAVPTEDRYRLVPLIELGWLRPVVAPNLELPAGKPLHVYEATFYRPLAH